MTELNIVRKKRVKCFANVEFELEIPENATINAHDISVSFKKGWVTMPGTTKAQKPKPIKIEFGKTQKQREIIE